MNLNTVLGFGNTLLAHFNSIVYQRIDRDIDDPFNKAVEEVLKRIDGWENLLLTPFWKNDPSKNSHIFYILVRAEFPLALEFWKRNSDDGIDINFKEYAEIPCFHFAVSSFCSSINDSDDEKSKWTAEDINDFLRKIEPAQLLETNDSGVENSLVSIVYSNQVEMARILIDECVNRGEQEAASKLLQRLKKEAEKAPEKSPFGATDKPLWDEFLNIAAQYYGLDGAQSIESKLLAIETIAKDYFLPIELWEQITEKTLDIKRSQYPLLASFNPKFNDKPRSDFFINETLKKLAILCFQSFEKASHTSLDTFDKKKCYSLIKGYFLNSPRYLDDNLKSRLIEQFKTFDEFSEEEIQKAIKRAFKDR